MKKYILLLIVLFPNFVFGDAYQISYKVRLDNSFLVGLDSAIVIVQNGEFIQKRKLYLDGPKIITLNYFIPCFSGRIMTKEEKIEEMLNWNGRVINFYYPSSKQTLSIPAISDNIFSNRIVKDSTYNFNRDMIVNANLDDTKFREKYIHFLKLESSVSTTGIERLLKKPFYSKQLIYEYLANVDFSGFTCRELNELLKTNFLNSGEYSFSRYIDGDSIGQLVVEIKNGKFNKLRIL